MFREDIKLSLQKALDELQIKEVKIELEHPAELTHGDYSINIALVSAKLLKKNPRQIAEEIAKMWEKTGLPSSVAKVEVAGAGFINIWLNSEGLSREVDQVLAFGKDYGRTEGKKGQTILLEHTSPNTNKSLHVGHVRNNITGMAIARILQFAGAKVVLDCLFNDRGIHICKAMWAYLKKDRMGEPWREVLEDWFNNQTNWPNPKDENIKPDKFVEEYYSLGVRVEDEGENRQEMEEMLIAWEAKDPLVRTLWKTLNDWFYAGVAQSFERLGSRHGYVWYESQFYEQAKDLVAEGLTKGVFRKLPDGAVLTDLEKEGLSDTVVQRADGTSMYFTQDIYLTKQKTEKFLADKYIWLVGPEQQLHLKQVFTVAEQLGIGSREKFLHLLYGYVFLKGKGKMSSRAGTVVTADSVMDEARDYALKLVQGGVGVGQLAPGEDKVIAEAVGIGAIKYALLKLTRTQDINFDLDESISLKGNSGPYLQYTYARTQSVVRKSQETQKESQELTGFDLVAEEEILLRTLYRFPEVIEEAAEEFAPNAVCNYLFDLSQKFNLFYDKHKILGSDREYFRLQLTKAVGQILQNGLELLGIETLDRI
ncbi:MAG: arginine--tRNA ligase [Patescibacteria group bacterium]|jgi:arginyl-tRNA synthetase